MVRVLEKLLVRRPEQGRGLERRCSHCGGEQLKWAVRRTSSSWWLERGFLPLVALVDPDGWNSAVRRIAAERKPGYADGIALLTAVHGAERKAGPEFSTALLRVSAGREDFQHGSGGYRPRALMRRRRDTACADGSCYT